MSDHLTTEDIAEADFVAYEKVRRSGRYNMRMEQTFAADAAGLDLTTYQAVMQHYTELCRLYPHVRNLS